MPCGKVAAQPLFEMPSYSLQSVHEASASYSADIRDLNVSRLSISDAKAELRVSNANGDSWEDEDRDSEDDEREGKGEEDGKKRDKNRRAQQRFRQRQKAKLHLKEQEVVQLQKQVQDLQAQLVGVQINGATGGMRQQLERMAAHCQALQAENRDIRALALRYLEENTLLRVANGMQTAGPGGLPPMSTAESLAQQPQLQVQQQVQRLLPMPMQMPGPMLTSSQQSKHSWGSSAALSAAQRTVGQQRATVFCNLSSIPWKIATASNEVGVPVGINPGGTGANILTKLLNKVADGSTTMLVQLPAGFEHDYLIRADKQVEEGLILAGSLTDTMSNKTYLPGDYCQILPGCQHGPYLADPSEGCLVFVITRVSMKMLNQPGYC